MIEQRWCLTGLISSQSHKNGDAALAVSLSVVLGVISLLVSVACYAWRKMKWTRGIYFFLLNINILLSYHIIHRTYSFNKCKNSLLGNTFIKGENLLESTKEDDMELPLFDLVEIEAATNNFSNEHKLGEGGFGPVYKVKLTC